jgi:xeroderma pigmentosum group C-complementing protein
MHTKRIKESPYPIFWVEAFNEADQKWIAVDPIVTKTVSKPSGFEPPASDTQNNLTYVLAFEMDGSARDVTRRYAKAFNAKARRGRLEAVQGGEIWWRRVMKLYRRSYDLPRDQIEDSELAAREEAEPMPRNVLDFKDHPYYALERHLKRSEVIHPKRAVGTVAAGRSGENQILEPVFRRRDVQVVKSGSSWYRLGREIKVGFYRYDGLASS